MAVLYPTYRFDAPAEGDGGEGAGLEDVVPIPEGVPIRHVYNEERLWALLEDDRALADAFYVWASESLGLYDYAREVAESQGIDPHVLERARETFLTAWSETRAHFSKTAQTRLDGVLSLPSAMTTRERLLDALAPFRDAGLPMTAIARYVELPLRDIVQVTCGSRAAIRPEVVALVEEELLGGALDRMSERQLALEHGVSRPLIRSLCELHGIVKPARSNQWASG